LIVEDVGEESYISAVDYESDVNNEVEQSGGVYEVSSEAEDMLSWTVEEEIREGQRRDKDISYVIVLKEKE